MKAKIEPSNMPSRLIITPGEPAGIGPDICLQAAQRKWDAELVVVADPTLLEERAKLLNLDLKLTEFNPDKPLRNGQGRLSIVPISLQVPCQPQRLNIYNSFYVVHTLTRAYELCEQKMGDALITGPVHKAIISQSGISFSGHTEFFAQCANTSRVLMLFYTPSLMVALATTHCALDEVSSQLSYARMVDTLSLLREGLTTYFNKPNPKIHVCGLNPHAGEEGTLGTQEQTILLPAIQSLQQQGFKIEGPLPADTAFSPENRHQCDVILAMYHDQGLAPLKALYFGEMVNVTLGLPFLRTSVDHGTALPLAGTGKARSSSFLRAITLAKELTEHSPFVPLKVAI